MIHYSASGVEARFSMQGHATFIQDQRRGITVEHEQGYSRVVKSVRPGQVQLVTFGTHHGYVQRPFRPGFVQRTYVSGNERSIAVYQERKYRGHIYYQYVTPFRYEPAFYLWLMAAWGLPVLYDGGFGGQAWYQANNSYFTASESYDSPAAMVADDVIGESIAGSYQPETPQQERGADADSRTSGDLLTPITPAIKQAVAADVINRFQRQQQEASQQDDAINKESDQIPNVLEDPKGVIVVAQDARGTLRDGSSCRLSGGDLISRISDTPSDTNTLDFSVLNAQQGEGKCPGPTVVAIDAVIAQELLNDYLRTSATVIGAVGGTHGIPPNPAAKPTRTLYATKPSDTNGDAILIQQQEQLANQSEIGAQLSARPPSD